jgi:hypothetical protein
MQKFNQFILFVMSGTVFLLFLFISSVPNINCTSITSSDTVTIAVHDTIHKTVPLDTICPFFPDTVRIKGSLIDCNNPEWFQTLSNPLITKCKQRHNLPNLSPAHQTQIDTGRILWSLNENKIGYLQFSWIGGGYSGKYELDSSRNLKLHTSLGEIEINVNKINAIFTTSCGTNDSAVVYTDTENFKGRLAYFLYFITDIMKVQISQHREDEHFCLRRIIK